MNYPDGMTPDDYDYVEGVGKYAPPDEEPATWKLVVLIEPDGFPIEELFYNFPDKESAITGQRIIVEASDHMSGALVSSAIVEE